LKQLGLHQ